MNFNLISTVSKPNSDMYVQYCSNVRTSNPYRYVSYYYYYYSYSYYYYAMNLSLVVVFVLGPYMYLYLCYIYIFIFLFALYMYFYLSRGPEGPPFGGRRPPALCRS